MNIEYIKNEDFIKLTKKQKLDLKEDNSFEDVEITKLLLIPTSKKWDGYKTGHFFALTKDGWFKPCIYDCWEIIMDSPAQIRYMILKGDFENDGLNIFTFIDEYHKAYLSYGGRITIKKLNI